MQREKEKSSETHVCSLHDQTEEQLILSLSWASEIATCEYLYTTALPSEGKKGLDEIDFSVWTPKEVGLSKRNEEKAKERGPKNVVGVLMK